LQSYKWISQKINGKPFSYRAVGSALKVNPVPIFIPCHRVIGENGNLCGYNSLQGISLKEKLINLEKNYEDSSIIE
jgi:O-6-methylguanine DNA methyltransferase